MNHELESAELSAYALGLLDDAGAALVERHVRGCAECARELAQYGAVTDLLPLALAREQPPAAAWQGVLPRVRGGRAQAPRSPSLAGRWAAAMQRLQPFALGALAAAVVGLLVWNVFLQRQVDDSSASASARSRWPGEVVAVMTGPPESAVSGRLYMSEDRLKGGLVVGELPLPAAGRSYQLWFVRSDQTRASGGTFSVDALGQAILQLDVPQPADDYAGVAVSEEPGSGSAVPTGRDVLAGPIYDR